MADDDKPDDLHSLLSQSFDDHAKSGAEPIVAETPKAEPEVDAGADKDKPSGDDRPRGPDGKFLKKDESDDVKAKDEPKSDDDTKKVEAKDEPKAKTEGDDKAKPDPKASDLDTKLARWSASDKAMFKLQSPEAQEFLLRRHAAMESEFTKRNQEIVDLKRDYSPVQALFAPYVDVLKQKGLTPVGVIQRWADVETKLARGEGINIIDGLVKGYNIDKAALAAKLGLTGAPSSQQTETTAPAGDDQAAKLLETLEQRLAQTFAPKLQKIEQWEAQQQEQTVRAQQNRATEIETKITNFKTATDKDGNLLHPYFEEVEQDMAKLGYSHAAMKQPIPELDQLYEQAVWANPSTRAALLATQKAAQEASAREEARAKSASARKAASSVTGAPGSGQASRPVKPELSLREQLAEAAADLDAA